MPPRRTKRSLSLSSQFRFHEARANGKSQIAVTSHGSHVGCLHIEADYIDGLEHSRIEPVVGIALSKKRAEFVCITGAEVLYAGRLESS